MAALAGSSRTRCLLWRLLLPRSRSGGCRKARAGAAPAPAPQLGLRGTSGVRVSACPGTPMHAGRRAGFARARAADVTCTHAHQAAAARAASPLLLRAAWWRRGAAAASEEPNIRAAGRGSSRGARQQVTAWLRGWLFFWLKRPVTEMPRTLSAQWRVRDARFWPALPRRLRTRGPPARLLPTRRAIALHGKQHRAARFSEQRVRQPPYSGMHGMHACARRPRVTQSSSFNCFNAGVTCMHA